MKKRRMLTSALFSLVLCTRLFAAGDAERTAESEVGQGRAFSIGPPAEITACLGDTIIVPILLSQPDFPIAAFLLSMVYPQDLLDYLSVDVSGTLMETWTMIGANENEPGIVRVAGITMEATVTGGVFFNAVFRVEAGIPGQGSICLSDFTDDLAGAQTSCGTVTTKDCSPTAVEEDCSHHSALPETYGLMQNYPNPFNPLTTISYTLPAEGRKYKVEGGDALNFELYTLNVTLRIFNVLGQEVAILVDEVQEPGYYTVVWNASDMPSGIYFYRLTAGEFSAVRQMLMMK